jgi:RNA-directed DNA polymerase
MSEAAELKLDLYRKAEALADVAKILGFLPAHVSYAIYKLPATIRYTEFSVLKKSGGERIIRAPHKTLKVIQKRLAQDLSAIEAYLEAKRVKKRDCVLAHGFKKSFSIMTNGENHRRRRFVLNIDLKDFFPSINFGRVYGFFLKNTSFGLKPKVAAVLAQIACHENELPQGSPCSPVISNLIAGALDIQLNQLARKYNCTYTRYADDITFSTSEYLFPSGIAQRTPGSINLWQASSKLLKIIKRAGFELNPSKTRMQLDHSRQDVTGVVVNQKVNIPASDYQTVAAMCHHMFMDGECFVTIGGIKKTFARRKLRGRLAYIYQVRGKGPKAAQKAEGSEGQNQKLWASFKLFERFLNYVDLYGAKRPVILCEGVTDNIYIKAAIQASPAAYPIAVVSDR